MELYPYSLLSSNLTFDETNYSDYLLVVFFVIYIRELLLRDLGASFPLPVGRGYVVKVIGSNLLNSFRL